MKDSIYNRVRNACTNPMLNKQQVVNEISQAANELAISRCALPRYMTITDRHTSIARRVLVPCGTCYQCLESRTNEWVTRMWHEASHYGENTHVYFVTLTYAGFRNYDNIPDFLLNAYWRKDTLNSYKTDDYRPCLCRFEHLAQFIRNFRRMEKNNYDDFDCSYVACCEYGHMWGAPHFHLILYTNHAISTAQIRLAWAFNRGTRKNPKWRCIGRIDCVDIKKNGTLVGTKDMNANKVFSYVAKYMYKMELPRSARVNLFCQDLKMGKVPDKMLLDVFDNNTLHQSMFRRHFYDYLAHYNNLLSPNVNDYKLGHFEIRNNPNTTKHEISLLDFSLDSDMEKSHILAALRTLHESDIVRQFRSQVRVSHSHAIGKNYIARNVEKFANSKLELGSAPFGKLVVPRYYEKVLANYFAPYAEIKNSPCGGSSSPLFVRKDKVALFADYVSTGGDLACLAPLLHPYFGYVRAQTSGELAARAFDKDPFADYREQVRFYNVDDILRSDYAFKDCRIGCRGFIHPNLDGLPRVLWYQYNRTDRTYYFVGYDELDDFAHFVVNAYNAYSLYKSQLIEKSNANLNRYLDLQHYVFEYFAQQLQPPQIGELPPIIKDFEHFVQLAKTQQDDERKTMSQHYWLNKKCTTKPNRLL